MKATCDTIESFVSVMTSIINACRFESYLELGVYMGSTLRSMRLNCPNLKSLVGVDICPLSQIIYCNDNCPSVKVFAETSTDQFFSTNQQKFDCVFIDACHDYAAVMTDTRNAVASLHDDGLIFLHDTYPNDIASTAHTLCSDAYKAYLELANLKQHECVTLPIFSGLTILRPVNPLQRILTLPADMQ